MCSENCNFCFTFSVQSAIGLALLKNNYISEASQKETVLYYMGNTKSPVIFTVDFFSFA